MENITSFNSITQYDKSFDGLFENIKIKGYSCSYFSILSSLRFLQGYFPDVDTHEKNVSDAMMLTCILNINSGLSFEDLILGCTNYDIKKIVGTTVELIQNNIIGFEQMFPKITHPEEKYCVVFLKNEKYFIVMVDIDGYYLRDCHIDVQYNFKLFNDLKKKLSEDYQFTKMINIDGFEISEYSSIEFLIFDQQFDTQILQLLEPQLQSSTIYNPENSENSENSEKIDKEKIKLLEGDILDIPEKTLFGKKDIIFLEKLNEQLSGKNESEKENNVQIEQITDDVKNIVIDEEKMILLELQKEFDEFENNQFVTSLLMDSVSPDDMVDFI